MRPVPSFRPAILHGRGSGQYGGLLSAAPCFSRIDRRLQENNKRFTRNEIFVTPRLIIHMTARMAVHMIARMTARLLLMVVFIGCFGLAFGAAACLAQENGASVSDPVAVALRALIDSGIHPALRWPEFPNYKDEMERLYGPRGYQPIWIADGKQRQQVQDVIRILGQAGTRGLPVEDYDVPYLETGWDRFASGANTSPQDVAALDLATSLLLMRHISDIHIGRINPANLGYGLEIQSKKYDLASLIRDGIEQNRLPQIVEAAEPQLHQYRSLKAALLRYRALENDSGLVAPPVAGTLRPGDLYAGAGLLARFLEALGDISAGQAGGSSYSGALVDGVKRFQADHGLKDDGVIGPKTWMHLRVPLRWRVRQLELGLERLRWLPEMPPGPLMVVNIPAFGLYVFDRPDTAGRVVLSMNVVVGEAIKQRTPVFVDRMTYLVFSPYWYPTRSIIRKEIVPGIGRDAKYLKKHEMELVPSTNDNAKALEATPQNLEKLRAGSITVRQRPGDLNSLGLVKFIFPNSRDIYLHDTPSRGLFGRERRDFSHGCIRVEKALELAEWVLRNQPEWTPERIQKAMHAGKPERALLTSEIPIYLLYTTAVARQDGSIVFYEDIYGYDEKLDLMLLEGEPYKP
jgi:L,D-transpeptidase YcbB